MAKNIKNESADDLLGDIKPKAKKVVKPAPKAAVAKKAVKPVAAKAVKAERAPRSTLAEDTKLKATKSAPREGSMFAIVVKAFGVGTTVKTGIERLRKTLVQPRGKAAKANPDSFIRGYVSGAVKKGFLANA